MPKYDLVPKSEAPRKILNHNELSEKLGGKPNASTILKYARLEQIPCYVLGPIGTKNRYGFDFDEIKDWSVKAKSMGREKATEEIIADRNVRGIVVEKESHFRREVA